MINSQSSVQVLHENEWSALRSRHAERLGKYVNPHLDRISRGEKHPVMDFLFTYYPYAPSKLLRWTPGWGVVLVGNIPDDLRGVKEATVGAAAWTLSIDRLNERRMESLGWMISLLEATLQRAPRFGCYGLHEWAMVYQSDEVRHSQLPLRLSREETARAVESLPIACSHYDAFRFFTPQARPMNRLQPTREGQLVMDQPGCLHANMDLYKWSMQFYPWVPGDLIADCFELAVAIREVDMRASPYDLSRHGLAPIKIEGSGGRSEYAAYQKQFYERATPLRRQLLQVLSILKNAKQHSQRDNGHLSAASAFS